MATSYANPHCRTGGKIKTLLCRVCKDPGFVYCSDDCHRADWDRHTAKCIDPADMLALRTKLSVSALKPDGTPGPYPTLVELSSEQQFADLVRQGKAPLAFTVKFINTIVDLTAHDDFFKFVISVLREHIVPYTKGVTFLMLSLGEGTTSLILENLKGDGPVRITACDAINLQQMSFKAKNKGRPCNVSDSKWIRIISYPYAQYDTDELKAYFDRIKAGEKRVHIIRDCPDLSTVPSPSQRVDLQQRYMEDGCVDQFMAIANKLAMADFLMGCLDDDS